VGGAIEKEPFCHEVGVVYTSTLSMSVCHCNVYVKFEFNAHENKNEQIYYTLLWITSVLVNLISFSFMGCVQNLVPIILVVFESETNVY